MIKGLRVTAISGAYAICRLPAEAQLPGWANLNQPAELASITRTADELSLLLPEEQIPVDVKCERGLRAIKVLGPLPLDAIGILRDWLRLSPQRGLPSSLCQPMTRITFLSRGRASLPRWRRFLGQDAGSSSHFHRGRYPSSSVSLLIANSPAQSLKASRGEQPPGPGRRGTECVLSAGLSDPPAASRLRQARKHLVSPRVATATRLRMITYPGAPR